MNVVILDGHSLNEVMNLFCVCFSEDSYYSKLLSGNDSLTLMSNNFRASISYCLENGFCVGIKDNERLVAYVLCFDYRTTKMTQNEYINLIFAGNPKATQLPYEDTLHTTIDKLNGSVLYCVSIAVDPQYQRKGLASGLIDVVMNSNPDCWFVSDVSNEKSLTIYKNRGFSVSTLDSNYYMIIHEPSAPTFNLCYERPIKVGVPDVSFLKNNGIEYTLVKETYYFIGCMLERTPYGDVFIPDSQSVAAGALVSLTYYELLKYQRLINLSQFNEKPFGDCLCYQQHLAYDRPLLLNDTLNEMIPSRKKEWAIIPDIFVSVPVEYCSQTLLHCKRVDSDENSDRLLKALDFRTHYEAGIPRSAEQIDDLSCFKRRIRRYYLGKIKVQISSEVTVDHYDKLGVPIGAAAVVDMYITIDSDSKCAVLTWFSLSAPFLISHLMDNVIRNQLQVIQENDQINFYDYLNQHYGLTKRGTSKIYCVVPNQKDCLSKSQLASLLAAETIYPDGENLGGIIDSEIMDIVSSDCGMGQYDRAFVYAYTNVVLQFSPDFNASLSDRLYEESITLFYIELILIEEASIHLADREIIALFTSTEFSHPVDFLKSVETIFDDYSRTIDFWDIQVNYPTSQKSINMLRDAFKIHEQLEYMHRNQAQLQTVFDTKCDIIDRQDSKRMDTSLAIISIFAVFSAWIDGHDYIATWSDVLSENAISILQRLLFLIILFTACYAVTHLFGNKFSLFIKERRSKYRRRNKRK